MNVEDNIAYGLRLRRWPKKERRRRVRELLELLHLDGLERRYPRQLSGGQQQRVALGRALAYHPAIILMDEPLGALDRALRLEMAAELRRIHRDLEATIIHVTHDQQEALALSDRIAIMRWGGIVGLGTPDDLYYRPPNRFVAEFFSNCNLVPVERHESRGDGIALVRHRGGEVVCPSMAQGSERAILAVRPRSLRHESVPGGLALRGTVKEAVLLGDEREILVEVPDVGRVLVIVEARDSRVASIGSVVEFHAPAGEIVLVPDD
jgi:ABC-type Fe3+/spermidine/putrescine transport system ATPase subunit